MFTGLWWYWSFKITAVLTKEERHKVVLFSGLNPQGMLKCGHYYLGDGF